MNFTRRTDRLVPESVWLGLANASAELLLTVAVLTGTASMVALSIGDPELVALVALFGVGVFLVGLAAIRMFTRLERRGLPIVE